VKGLNLGTERFRKDFSNIDSESTLLLHICDAADVLLNVEAPLGFKNSQEYPQLTGFGSELRPAIIKQAARILLEDYHVPTVSHEAHWKMHGHGDGFSCPWADQDNHWPNVPAYDKLVHYVEFFTALVKRAHNAKLEESQNKKKNGAITEKMEDIHVQHLKHIATKISRAYPSVYKVNTDIFTKPDYMRGQPYATTQDGLRGDSLSASTASRGTQNGQARTVHKICVDQLFKEAWRTVSGTGKADIGNEDTLVGVDKSALLDILPTFDGDLIDPHALLNKLETVPPTIVQEADFEHWLHEMLEGVTREILDRGESYNYMEQWLKGLERIASSQQTRLRRLAVVPSVGILPSAQGVA